MKPAKPLKRRRKGEVSRLKEQADKLWKVVVKERAGFRCEKCGTTKEIQAHHFVPRTNHRLRFDLCNGVSLCKRHHLYWAHQDPEFVVWFSGYRPDDYAYLMDPWNRRLIHRTPDDYRALIEDFRGLAAA